MIAEYAKSFVDDVQLKIEVIFRSTFKIISFLIRACDHTKLWLSPEKTARSFDIDVFIKMEKRQR